jgi:hypothetical protein
MSSSIKSDFDSYGLDSSGLGELIGICSWLDDQQPMLTRRYHLSMAADKPYPGHKGMVSIDESMVGQTAQSQKDGKSLADQYNKTLDDGDAIPEELFNQLQAHKDDADYIKAFYDQLGPQRFQQISNNMASNPYDDRYRKHPDQLEHDRSVLANTFGTYTQVKFEGKSAKDKQAGWNKWFDDFKDPRNIFRPDDLIPLLKVGTQDKDFLVALGDRVLDNKHVGEREWMNGDGMGNGPWGKDHYGQLFDAISNNPEASGEFVDHNYDTIQSFIYPGTTFQLDQPKSRAASFMKILHASTITLRATNEPLAEKLTAHLMSDNYQHTQSDDTKSIHPVDGMDAFYGDLVRAYWNDLEYGTTSPMADKMFGNDATVGGYTKKASGWDEKAFLAGQDPKRFGMELSGPMWESLVAEASRDPHTAGQISATFDAYRLDLDTQIAHTKKTDPGSSEYLNIKQGEMMKLYGKAFDSAMATTESDAQAWADGVNSARSAMIDAAYHVGEVGVTGGGAAALDAVKETGTGLATDTVNTLLTGWAKDLVSVKPEQAPGGLADKYKALEGIKLDTSWRNTYRTKASLLLSPDPHNGLKGGWDKDVIPPVTIGPIHPVKGNPPVTYTGNPAGYIKNRDQNFLNKDGSVMDESKMSVQQQAAYAKWLQDPAVAAMVKKDGFDTTELMQNLPE